MSTKKRVVQLKSLDIVKYLQKHPDFFQDKDDLVESLELTHNTMNANGKTISLIEHQVDLLRQQNSQLNQQLNELFSIAKENEHATQKMHQLILSLLSCQRLHDIVSLLQTRLVADFAVDSALLKLFSIEKAVLDTKNTINLDENSVQAKTLKKLIHKREPICGFFKQLDTQELQINEKFEAKSMAVMPLFVDKNNCFGVLILASEDQQHFRADNGILFLKNLAEIVSATLVKYL